MRLQKLKTQNLKYKTQETYGDTIQETEDLKKKKRKEKII